MIAGARAVAVVAGAAVAGAALAACLGHPQLPVPPAPPAAVTAGDTLLADLPAGADVVVELDLARLYANPTVGALARRALAVPSDALRVPGVVLPRGAAPLADATLVVMAAYHVGTADAVTVTLVATTGEVPNGTSIGDGVVALAPPAMVAQVAALANASAEARAMTAAGQARPAAAAGAGSLARDAALLALRARAVPPGAPGAVLRVTARLGLDARVALAPVLGPDLAPASLSLWADVVDDAALVAVIDGHDAAGGGGARLAAALERVRIALAGSTELLRLGAAPVVRGVQLQRRGDVVRVIATIGPRRLGELASRLAAAPAPAYPPGP